jgi:hypothetical protein
MQGLYNKAKSLERRFITSACFERDYAKTDKSNLEKKAA